MKFLSIIGCVLVCFLVLPFSYAEVEVGVYEAGKIMNYYDEFYVYQLNGTINISNPSNSSLYNINIPFHISSLSLQSNDSTGLDYITENQIFIHALDSMETITFHYVIRGISSEDLVKSEGSSVLGSVLTQQQPKIYSEIIGSLLKAPLEIPSAGGKPNTRLISVSLRNPSNFSYTIEKLNVIKTSAMNPNEELDSWSFAAQKSSLAPYENYDFDFLDENAIEGEVYWLSSDIYIGSISVSSFDNITYYTQNDLFTILSNDTINFTINKSLGFLSDRIYLRKFTSSSVVNPGDTIDLTMIINNLEPQSIDVKVLDTFPRGFDIVQTDGGVVNKRNITWNLTIPRNSVKRLRYSLMYTDSDTLGLDYFPSARLLYKGNEFTSQSVPFIRKYVPEKKVFVQKNVHFVGSDEAQVKITISNLGEEDLKDIIMKEHLLSSAEFREISVAPVKSERGVWLIDTINSSSAWEVSYVTNRDSVLNTMPEVYGVTQGSVLQTIILSNVIDSSFAIISTNIVEIIAIILLAIIFILYFLPPSYFSKKRKRQARDLSLIANEIDHLHQKTMKKPTAPAGHFPHSSQGRQAVHHHHSAQHSGLQSPERVARHKSIEETASLLAKSKEEMGITSKSDEAENSNSPPKETNKEKK